MRHDDPLRRSSDRAMRRERPRRPSSRAHRPQPRRGRPQRGGRRGAAARGRGRAALLDMWIAEPLGLAGSTRDAEPARPSALARSAAGTRGQRPASSPQRASPLAARVPRGVRARGAGSTLSSETRPGKRSRSRSSRSTRATSPGFARCPRRSADRRSHGSRKSGPSCDAPREPSEAGWQRLRATFAADAGYAGGAGDPDLYKFFCQRYRRLARPRRRTRGRLPRSTFLTKGSAEFRDAGCSGDDGRAARLPSQHAPLGLRRRAAVHGRAPRRDRRRRLRDEHRLRSQASPTRSCRVSAADRIERDRARARRARPRRSRCRFPVARPRPICSRSSRRGSPPFRLAPVAGGCFPVAEFHETNDQQPLGGARPTAGRSGRARASTSSTRTAPRARVPAQRARPR